MKEGREDTFAEFGKDFQEKICIALFQDHLFAEQMTDLLNPNFLEPKYLQEIVRQLYEHKKKYLSYPSIELINTVIQTSEIDDLIKQQANQFLKTAKTPLNGDAKAVQDLSLDFCKRQNLLVAMMAALEIIKDKKYEAVLGIVKKAVIRGYGTKDLGHNYMKSVDERLTKGIREPLKTGWDVLDRNFNGGWERKTLTTIIAPTSGGKSHWLVNCSAQAIQNGYKTAYITCEMDEYKIGHRHDAYFSGIEINDIQNNGELLKKSLKEKVNGELLRIKEYPTKKASVETIRNYLSQLRSVENFEPDVVIVDYADLLRSSRGFDSKRFELELIYEELRALAQELNIVLITADQTNRGGLNKEIITIGDIGESYSKAQICDVILTLARTLDDQKNNAGRILIAKSRLGASGVILPILFNPAFVKMILREPYADMNPIETVKKENPNLESIAAKSFDQFNRNGKN